MQNTRCSLLPPLAELEAQRAADKAEQTTAGGATESGSATPEASDAPVLVDLVVLTGVEETEALKLARAYAVTQGIADPKPNEPIYDLAVMVHTLVIGCVDHDSPSSAPLPFFANPEQLLQGMSRDQITYLYALHEHWQDDCSPQAKDLSEEEFYGWLVGVAESESPSDFFAKSRPRMLSDCMRTLAKLSLISRLLKSEAGSTSEASIDVATAPMPAKPKAR